LAKNVEECYAVADSGANIAVFPTTYASLLGIKLRRWESPVMIAFGKVGACSVSIFYGNFGALLGRVAFLDDAAEALVPVWQITRNGFEVVFGESTVEVVEAETRQTVVRGYADKVQCLWYFCINDFVCAYAPEVNAVPLDKTDGKVRIAKRQKRVSQKLVDAVHWLHKCMGHAASPTTMAKCLKEGAWRGVPLDIDDKMVLRVLERVQCVACKLGLTNKLPTPEGVGMREWEIGEIFSVDAIVKVNPVSVRGYTGFYLIKELRTGHLTAVPFKIHDAENLIAAVKEVYLFFRSY
jgi:hypothetical protein